MVAAAQINRQSRRMLCGGKQLLSLFNHCCRFEVCLLFAFVLDIVSKEGLSEDGIVRRIAVGRRNTRGSWVVVVAATF